MYPVETIYLCLVRYWFHQTIWIRCSKSAIGSCKNIQDEPELNRSKGESMSTTEVGQLVVNYILIFSYTAPFLNFFFL